jgi:ankyrin repeat protein
MKKTVYILLFISCIIYSSCTGNYLGGDIRLFRNTPVWKLAQAVQRQDTAGMQKIIDKGNINIDYQEPKFGETLLMIAAYRQWKASVEVLLRNGADPNLPDNYDALNAIIYASGWGPDYEDDPDLLRLVLQYGGDPNYIAIPKREEDFKFQTTPLMKAAFASFEKMKILVEAGADINYNTPGNRTALWHASSGNIDTPVKTKYLLEQGADCNTIIAITINGDTLRLADRLRRWVYPLDSEDYRIKMEIVKMLKDCGQDYWSIPVPKDYYKHYSQEYLEKY